MFIIVVYFVIDAVRKLLDTRYKYPYWLYTAFIYLILKQEKKYRISRGIAIRMIHHFFNLLGCSLLNKVIWIVIQLNRKQHSVTEINSEVSIKLRVGGGLC